MTKVVLMALFIFVRSYLEGQNYHYSSQYEADTAIYEARKRHLLEKYTKEYKQGIRFVPSSSEDYRKKGWFMPPGPLTVFTLRPAAWELARDRAWSQGLTWYFVCAERRSGLQYYENDTLRCEYRLSCTEAEQPWRKEVVSKREEYRNGITSTTGDFLVLSSPGSKHSIPINRHVLYWKNGKLKSIATFDKYGRPINDSLFDNKGRFKEIREIDINEVVPVK